MWPRCRLSHPDVALWLEFRELLCGPAVWIVHTAGPMVLRRVQAQETLAIERRRVGLDPPQLSASSTEAFLAQHLSTPASPFPRPSSRGFRARPAPYLRWLPGRPTESKSICPESGPSTVPECRVGAAYRPWYSPTFLDIAYLRYICSLPSVIPRRHNQRRLPLLRSPEAS
jgi:hypothetical protein